MSLYTPFFLVSPHLRFFPLRVSRLRVLEKLRHVRVYDEQTEKKSDPRLLSSRVRALISSLARSLSPLAFSRCSPRTPNRRGARKAHFAYILRRACPSPVRIYIFTLECRQE